MTHDQCIKIYDVPYLVSLKVDINWRAQIYHLGSADSNSKYNRLESEASSTVHWLKQVSFKENRERDSVLFRAVLKIFKYGVPH